MQYLSTRSDNDAPRLGFTDILLAGLAPDSGLYLPTEYPHVDTATLAAWRQILAQEGYPGLAHAVLSLFVDDIPSNDLRAICKRAYNPTTFADPEIVPVSQLRDGLSICHLSEGPTAAFKDLAMQLLGQLFEYQLARTDARLNILGATSGDTGSAAEHAMLGRPGIRVFMLTPAGRMTAFQKAQMFSLDDPSVVNVAVDGVFDDCQDLVKAVTADADFKKRYRLGAVNSINWARLAAQIVYYFAAWLKVTDSDDQEVSFAVPTGNFGNICAGHIARQMGLPISRLVLATNENNVLDEFFRTGIYRVRSGSETLATSSPSMDISKASNFERFIYDLFNADAARVRKLFAEDLPSQGYFDLSQTEEFAGITQRFGIVSGSSTHAERVETIASVWRSDQVLIDPHTADGVNVARQHRTEGTPMVVTETALPVKFAETIEEAIGAAPPRPQRFVGIEDLPQHVVELPNEVQAVKDLIAARVKD